MINHKKKILIKKHLGENTPEWIINNCIAMLNEYEEVELEEYTKAKNNESLHLVIYRYLKDNLDVIIEQDHKFSDNTGASLNLVVTLNGNKICENNFTMYYE